MDGIKGDINADPASIESILNNAQVTPPPAKIEAQRADIDRLFASDRYEDILAALKADGSAWADKQITTLATKSPQTIKVALRQLAEGGRMTDRTSTRLNTSH